MSTYSVIQPPSAAIDLLVEDCLLQIFSIASSGWDATTLFAISQVCRHWRGLALSIPALWSQIGFGLTDTTSISPNYIHKADLMFQRSCQYPLYVRVIIPADIGQTWFFNVTLPNILSPHLSRIAMFDLANLSQTWGAHCLLLAMFARQKSLPLLRSFAVRCPHDKDQVFSTAYSIEALYAGTPPVPFVGAENSAVSHPNLKEVTLDATFCDWTKYSGRNLTTLNLSMIPTFYRPTIAQLRTILTMSKDTLKVLKIAGALPREQRKENVIIEMGQLESLSLLYTIPYEIAIFTDSIRVPALKNLEIGNLGYLLTPAVPPLIHDRFYAQIAYVFRRILGEFPVENLEEVALLNVEFGSEVLLGLLAHTEPLELLRRLEKGVQKMKVESGDGSFGWVAGAEGLAHALETWKLKVAVGDHVPSRALRRLNYP